MLLLATISLNGMYRLGQQSLPALRAVRSKFGKQPVHLPAPGTCPAGLKLVQQRGLFTTPRIGTYGGNQQASFNRGAFLLGGIGAAALASKAAYDYFDTRDHNVLKRAYAAEKLSREEILLAMGNKHKQDAEILAPMQHIVDVLYKVKYENGTLSEEEKTNLKNALPLLLAQEVDTNAHLFWGDRYENIAVLNGTLHLSLFSSIVPSFFLKLLETINKPLPAPNINTDRLYQGRSQYFAPKNASEEHFINAIIDKAMDTALSNTTRQEKYRATELIIGIFDKFPSLRLHILDKFIQTSAQDDKTGAQSSRLQFLASRIHHAIEIQHNTFDKKLDQELKNQSNNDLPLAILKHFAAQDKGAGKLFTIILNAENPHTWSIVQKLSGLLAQQVIEHPELESSLAATYNNPAPEFNSFREWVDNLGRVQQNKFYSIPQTFEYEALNAIKHEALRQAKASTASGRVQE